MADLGGRDRRRGEVVAFLIGRVKWEGNRMPMRPKRPCRLDKDSVHRGVFLLRSNQIPNILILAWPWRMALLGGAVWQRTIEGNIPRPQLSGAGEKMFHRKILGKFCLAALAGCFAAHASAAVIATWTF